MREQSKNMSKEKTILEQNNEGSFLLGLFYSFLIWILGFALNYFFGGWR